MRQTIGKQEGVACGKYPQRIVDEATPFRRRDDRGARNRNDTR